MFYDSLELKRSFELKKKSFSLRKKLHELDSRHRRCICRPCYHSTITAFVTIAGDYPPSLPPELPFPPSQALLPPLALPPLLAPPSFPLPPTLYPQASKTLPTSTGCFPSTAMKENNSIQLVETNIDIDLRKVLHSP